MVGLSRRTVLGVESPDPILSLVASLGLAIVANTALVIDLEGGVAAKRSLGDIVSDGHSLRDLSPGRPGVAVLSGAGVATPEWAGLIEQFGRHWPAIVVRNRPGDWAGPTVPVRPVIPGLLHIPSPSVAVWQPSTRLIRPPGEGPVLPPLRRRTARSLLEGRMIPRTTWIRAWEKVWDLPWA